MYIEDASTLKNISGTSVLHWFKKKTAREVIHTPEAI